ncbi:MAG: amidohydrolase family protein [Myxococcales bacterium]|nr:amidohydrolase family protein [Myxococcales bacterium]
MIATRQLLRGDVLTAPRSGDVRLLRDHVVVLADGRIDAVRPPQTGDPTASDLLLLPGFVDLHCHWPQGHVRGRFSGALLPWLRTHIWPAEAKFDVSAVATQRAASFVAELLSCGTTAGMFFGPPFLEASRRFLTIAPAGMIDGPAIMETNCPTELQQPASDVLKALQAVPPGERARLVVSPRFAPNLTREGLAGCGKMARDLGLPAQSHLSENTDEIAWVQALYPEASSYTDVYDRAGLLGPHVVLAHGVHLSDTELARLAETGTIVAHCPTSNAALGSGRMPVERLNAAEVPWVLATDVGAGPQLSQLHVMAEFIAQHEQAGVTVTACEALDRATRVPGTWLAERDDNLVGLGTLTEGAPGHVVAVRSPGGQSAEDTLRNLFAAAAPAYETAAQQVWCWGEPVQIGRG